MSSTAIEMGSTPPIGASEATPLLGGGGKTTTDGNGSHSSPPTTRDQIYLFLEAQTSGGKIYESFTIFLILLNVGAFIGGTLFVEEYNNVSWAQREGGICGDWCDAIWFGNYADNKLEK